MSDLVVLLLLALFGCVAGVTAALVGTRQRRQRRRYERVVIAALRVHSR